MASPLVVPKNFKYNFFFFDCVSIDPFVVASSNQNAEYVVMVIDPTQVEVDLANIKEKKKMYEMNHHFQNSWVAKLPWIEFVMVVDGKVTQIKCKVCIVIEG